MKRSKKVMALVLALSMVLASGTLAFADVEDDANVGTADANTAADTFADEVMSADADEETKADAEVAGESTEGETGEETGEVCEHNLVWKKTVLPTCAEAGRMVFQCAICGEDEVTELTQYPHQMKVIDVQKPTATTEGKSTSKCTVCGHTEEKSIPVITDEKEVTVTVRIKIYDTKEDQYGVYVPGELKKQIKLGYTAKSYEEYSLDITEILHAQTYLNDGRLGKGVTVEQLRAVDCTITGGQYCDLQLVLDDTYNYEKQFIEGFVGTEGIIIDISARPWHNFTQICYYFEQPDGKWSMKPDPTNPYGYLGLNYKDTLLNTQVEYRPELTEAEADGYEYADYRIGYFHNPGSLKPDQISISKDDLGMWGLTANDQGVITGTNINFYADDQLFISYKFALKAYNVNYNLAGGNVNGATEIATQTAKRTATVSVVSDPTRSGYAFKGWTVTADNGQPAPEISADGKFTMPAANVTLTANWEPVPYIPPYNPPTIDPVIPVDPVNPQPLPPDDPLEDPEKPVVNPQPLPPDDPLIEEDPKQPLPEDEHLIDPTDAEKAADPDQPKTGDEAPLMALTGLFFAAAGALGAIYIRKRTEK